MRGNNTEDEKARVANWYGKLCHLSHDKIPPWLVYSGLERLGLGDRAYRVKRSMLAHPRCFRAGWTWMLLFYAGMIVNAIDPKWRGDQRYDLVRDFKMEKNNLFDDRVAAASAYCHRFIVADRGIESGGTTLAEQLAEIEERQETTGPKVTVQ